MFTLSDCGFGDSGGNTCDLRGMYIYCPARVGICDLVNPLTSCHKQLWRPPAANRLSVTSRILWPLVTRNYGGLQQQKSVFV